MCYQYDGRSGMYEKSFKNTDRDFLNYQKIIENDFIMIRLAVIWTIMNCLNN